MYKRWTKEEEELLRNIYKSKSYPKIFLENLLPGRTSKSIQKKVAALHLHKRKGDWTSEEDEIIIKYYSDSQYQSLMEMLSGRTKGAINTRAQGLNIKKNKSLIASIYNRIYSYNHDYFNIPNLESSYWGGFIAADGCIVKNNVIICLSEVDKNHLESFSNCVTFNGNIIVYAKNSGFKTDKKTVEIRFNGAHQWISDLNKWYNITPRKSMTLEPPTKLNRECSLAYIKGYIDGDGSIGYMYTNKGKYKLRYIEICGTEQHLLHIKNIFDELVPAIKYKNSKHIRCRGSCYTYHIAGSRADKIFDILKVLPTPKLDRKWNK